ncbi:MAG: hypothetical protein LBD75_02575 [Candidatus Peribacteria bacterium]|jgi:hypothetical protein|nr:hypothetical protein [Candidatus Peribacteria bacterium]
MEYIDGKTLYTLILETIIKTLKAKIQKISLYSFEEWKEEGMKQFQKEWKAEKQKAISGAKSLCAINIESMEASYVRLPKKIREQSIQNERNKY